MESEATKFLKGGKLAEGKTKIIWEDVDCDDCIIVENKPEITAHDDPAYTKRFEKKAEYATTTTCKIFELLNEAGIPTSFIKQLSPTEFLAKKCEMIPLEVVARRLAVGSFLKRHPEFTKKGERPHRFHRLVTEFFLKTTKGKVKVGDKEIDPELPLVDGKEGKKPLEDPLIDNPAEHEQEWRLFDPKKPDWEKNAVVGRSISVFEIFSKPRAGAKSPQEIIVQIDGINRQAFLLIEAAWAILGFLLIDWKIEFGWTIDGQLVIADVIDNDAWRLRDREFKEVSKQVFRDGGELDEVEAKYGYVANMVSQFRLPKQALVLWRGSDKDKFPEIFIKHPDGQPEIPGVKVIEVTASGHKSTNECLKKLEDILRDFPDGGVIVVKVGMSNGLGPVLASHSSWPVVAIPASAKEFPEDIWSSLRMPSDNPMATILSEANAVLYALNILAQKNPALYAIRQSEIEALDAGY